MDAVAAFYHCIEDKDLLAQLALKLSVRNVPVVSDFLPIKCVLEGLNVDDCRDERIVVVEEGGHGRGLSF